MKPLNMRKNETAGLLITFCGLDGCGKTTMMNRLISDFEAEMKAQALPLVVTGDEAEPLLPLLSAPYLFEKDLAHKGLHHLALLNEKKSGNPPKRV